MTIVGEAHVIVRAITTGVQRDVEDAINRAGAGNLGRNFGNQFAQGFSRTFSGSNNRALSQFRREAVAAADAFRVMVTQGYFMGPAISVAVGAVSSLVSGLTALTSQVALALPSLIVLPSLFSAMGQAMITAKMAFKGIGEAMKSMGKGAKGVDRMPSLLERVAAARDRSLQAAGRERDAYAALTRAYETAAEALQQLNFDAEDAAIAEKRASMALEDARATLARVQDLPPNNRARQEAELAFQEADLNYRRAIDRNKDLTAETEKRNAAGVEGSDEVLDAQKAYTNALYEQQKAAIALTKAEKELQDYKEGKNQGGGGASQGPKISKEAKEFAKFLKSLAPLGEQLRASAGERLFPRLQVAIQTLVDNIFPRLIPILRNTGDALGYTAQQFAAILSSANNLKNLSKVADTNVETIRKLGTVLGNLVSVALAMLAAADPLVDRFTDWAVALTNTWRAAYETEEATDRLTKKFNFAGDIAAQLGRVLKNVWDALKNIGRAASGPGSGGEMLLNAFEGATKKFKEFTAELEKSGRLEEYFRDVATNVIEIGRAINTLAVEFLKLGDDGAVGKTARLLPDAFRAIGDALAKLMEGAPALGDFAGKLVTFLALFAESESINNFFKVLSFAADVLIKIFSNETIAKITMFVSANLAFVKAFQLLSTVGNFAINVVAGYFIKLGNAITFMKNIPGALSTLYNSTIPNLLSRVGILETAILKLSYALNIGVGASSLIVVAAIAAVIAIFVAMYMKSEKLRKSISNLVDGVLNALKEAWDRINEAIREAIPQFEGVGDIFKKLGDFFGTYIVPLFEVILVGAIEMTVDRIVGLIKIVGGVIRIFQGLWEFVKGFFALLSGDVDGAAEKFKSAFQSMKDGLVRIFSGLADIMLAPFRFAFNLIAKMWNNTIAGFEFTIPRWIPVIGGEKFRIPKMPEWTKGLSGEENATGMRGAYRMALGGTVMPRRGGSLALIAEAGRPERVEPLDPDGLSKRDKAIITMLTGGMAGATINVYPSPGMDEVELASLVNRQIAFQLRKGAA